MKYIDLRKALFFTQRTDFVKYVLKSKKVKIMDVGNLGEGPVNVDIRNTIEANGGEYFGLDVNKNLADKLGFTNQLIGDLHNLKEIEAATFDCVYGGEIIEHTWYPAEMIKECSRILKPNGTLILDTPNVFDAVNIGRLLWRRQDTLGLNDSNLTYQEAKDNFKNWREERKETLSQPQHKILYSPAMMQQLLNMGGFDIEQLVFIGKSRNWLHGLLLKIYPQLSQKLGIVATKSSLEKIFKIDNV